MAFNWIVPHCCLKSLLFDSSGDEIPHRRAAALISSGARGNTPTAHPEILGGGRKRTRKGLRSPADVGDQGSSDPLGMNVNVTS